MFSTVTSFCPDPSETLSSQASRGMSVQADGPEAGQTEEEAIKERTYCFNATWLPIGSLDDKLTEVLFLINHF